MLPLTFFVPKKTVASVLKDPVKEFCLPKKGDWANIKINLSGGFNG